ncbi:MAG: hypothetical protein QJR07_07945 [Acetobacteraceae bacterium]|nr:hypothetical protein [Acetobacteraceae bacterium]MDI3307022.1 hypothetical protein [Acetobacteraceae bacterium]
MESAFEFVRRKPWQVFAALLVAGTACALLGIPRLGVILFMLSGLLVMWQSTLLPPSR